VADYDMTRAKADPEHVPPEIDPTQPSVARVYDAILGGRDSFAADRAVAAEAVRAMGDGGNGARLNRAALGRAVRYMAAAASPSSPTSAPGCRRCRARTRSPRPYSPPP
jgi:hypothetical protein